jgi:hypothetical protein
MPRRHDLKCWPGPFQATVDEVKTFEWRKDDRGFEVGDELLLREWEPCQHIGWSGQWVADVTYRWCLVKVTYILRGQFDVPAGYCVMAIEFLLAGDKDAKPPTPPAP